MSGTLKGHTETSCVDEPLPLDKQKSRPTNSNCCTKWRQTTLFKWISPCEHVENGGNRSSQPSLFLPWNVLAPSHHWHDNAWFLRDAWGKLGLVHPPLSDHCDWLQSSPDRASPNEQVSLPQSGIWRPVLTQGHKHPQCEKGWLRSIFQQVSDTLLWWLSCVPVLSNQAKWTFSSRSSSQPPQPWVCTSPCTSLFATDSGN